MNNHSIVAYADEINREHEFATNLADEAVVHAKRAGVLLLKAKAEIPHGGFGAWITSHLNVSQRQAQRYMAAALGKAIPVRALTHKSDTVSHLIRDIQPGEYLRIVGLAGNKYTELVVMPQLDNQYVHTAYIEALSLDGEFSGGICTYSKRGVSVAGLKLLTEHGSYQISNPEIVERYFADGVDRNPYAEVGV